MSRIFLIGDTHLGLGYPNKADRWHRVHNEYFEQFLIPYLEQNVRDGDIIVHLGDLYDDRNIIPIHYLNYGMDIVERIAKIAPLHILVGNHDLWSKSASDINTLRPMRYMPNVNIYSITSVLEFNGKQILMMPYIDRKSEQVEIISKYRSTCNYLFCHSDLNGCRMHLTSVAHRNHDKIEIEEFESFEKVMSGHIHITQKHNNFTFVGSNFQMDRNDYGDTKGIIILDTNTNDEVFVPNTISPIFDRISVTQESDIDVLRTKMNTRNYVDVFLSNALLVSSRKVRRELEDILQTGNFESVTYINDIVKEVKDDIPVLDIGDDVMEISGNLDYVDYLRQYVDKLSYNGENFKAKTVETLEQIIDIYNNNYRS